MKATLSTRILPASRLLSVAALWAFLGRVRLINTFNGDSSQLGFVLDHPTKLAISPLVEALVHLRSIVDPITDAANITDCNRRDTSLKEHLHDLSAQFMKKVRDLVVDVLKLLVFGLNELLPAIRAALFAVDLRVELGLKTVLVVTEGTKLPTVDREGVFAGDDSSEVLLSEIDSSNFVSGGSVNGLSVVLCTHNEPVRSLSDLDSPRLFVYGPVDQNRVVAALRGQTKNTVVSKGHALAGPSEHIVLLIAAFWRAARPVIVMPGPDGFVELLGDFLVGDFLGRLRRQHVVALTVPPPHRCFREPVVLSVYRAPVPLADGVPQIRRRTRQPIKLLGALNMVGALNMECAGQVRTQIQVHTQIQKPSQASAGGTGLKAKGPAASYQRGQTTILRFDCGVPRPPSLSLGAQRQARKVPEKILTLNSNFHSEGVRVSPG